jgi:hypothetical protein
MNLKEKREELKSDYKNLEDKKEVQIISNKILDVFELEYANLLRSESPDYSELKEFIMFFIHGKFQKQLKFDLWTAMAFYKSTEVTREVINVMRKKYNK